MYERRGEVMGDGRCHLVIFVDGVHTAATSGAAVLRILTEGHHVLHPVLLHGLQGLLGERSRVPEGHVGFVGGRLRAELVQLLTHELSLLLGPLVDRTAWQHNISSVTTITTTITTIITTITTTITIIITITITR